jgi:hypothetical protein
VSIGFAGEALGAKYQNARISSNNPCRTSDEAHPFTASRVRKGSPGSSGSVAVTTRGFGLASLATGTLSSSALEKSTGIANPSSSRSVARAHIRPRSRRGSDRNLSLSRPPVGS